MSGSDRPSPGAIVLIIEEDDVTATDLQTGLVGAGYGVVRAGSADEALGTLDSMRVDLILMSLMLPDADGLILCSPLKTRSPEIPVVITSARAREVDRALALESGAADVLALPVERQELLNRVMAIVQPRVSSQTRGV